MPLIINDDADLALAVGAAGVHVGQKDLPVLVVRRLLPFGWIVGASANNVDEARRAESDGADYVSVGNLFGTSSKEDTRSGHPGNAARGEGRRAHPRLRDRRHQRNERRLRHRGGCGHGRRDLRRCRRQEPAHGLAAPGGTVSRLMRAGKVALLIGLATALCLLGRQTAPADARFSRSGVISFIARSDFESSLRQVTPGQNSGFLVPPDFAVSSYAWAPDGGRVAFVATAADVLWVENLFDGGMTHIADNSGTATWSPDGTQLAFTNSAGTTLSVSSSAGTGITPIAQGNGLQNPAWSPLGDAIVFEAGSALNRVSPAGSAAKTLDSSHGYKKPAWSPFGDMIAVLNSANTIVILNPDGACSRRCPPPLARQAFRGPRTRR